MRLKFKIDFSQCLLAKIGDILYTDTCLPYAAQESEELDDEIIARLNPASGSVENLEILFFSQRTEPLNLLALPISPALQIAS
ncbi:MAG: DUF2283 domain-containing protein [Pegethrix bostrychoides GSE-TBD4-15B]|jgi:hypothetical protein|uniref:DUF2283 domain-containing protein n=1 Tax=Pegethrix bostrychoides GSE-TBD4-15B TaxID=2839662 RepID=A0A951P945_9CYAN|nr:DUF2283 domain-containing protein [Pegethrix bostrychoides GSE-TBD4-15B]